MLAARNLWSDELVSDEENSVIKPLPSWIAPRALTAPSHGVEILEPRAPMQQDVETRGERAAEERAESACMRVSERAALPAEGADESRDAALIAELEVMRAENDELRNALADAAVAMSRLREGLLAESEPELVRLAVAIAERVIGRELETDPTLVAAWAREGLTALSERADVEIVVSSDVAAAIPTARWGEVVGGACEVRVDPALPRAHCEIRAKTGRIDESLESRLRAVVDAMGVPCTRA